MKAIKYKLIIAPDSFKESLSSIEVCEHFEAALRPWKKHLKVIKFPLADGGEGTIDTLKFHFKNTQEYSFEVWYPALKRNVLTASPQQPDLQRFLKKKTTARVLFFNKNKTAFLELAQAAGFQQLKPSERFPLLTTTYGLGELIKQVITTHKPQRIYLNLGGSATNDLGLGMAAALGFRFLDSKGKPLLPIPSNMPRIRSLLPPTDRKLMERILRTHIITLTDVQNPLLGPHGATFTYARQKGATEEMLPSLERGMKNLNRVLATFYGKDVSNEPGTGAAGGMGAGAMYFLNATLTHGARAIAEFLHFEEKVKDALIIITGEGRIDNQTRYGKVVKTVADIGKKYAIPVIAVAGEIDLDYEAMKEIGASFYMPLTWGPLPKKEAIAKTPELIKKTAAAIVYQYLSQYVNLF